MITVIVVKVERYGFTLPECIQKGGDGIANSVDPDQTAPRSSLFWVCTVCSDLSVPILRTFTVFINFRKTPPQTPPTVRTPKTKYPITPPPKKKNLLFPDSAPISRSRSQESNLAHKVQEIDPVK